MGGAYGHLSHPYDIEDFTFNDLKEIIMLALSGNLHYAEEKTDAVNLMVSWKAGRLIAARSKTHLKNAGAQAMSTADVIAKFKGRGLEVAYGEAMHDLTSAISKLSDRQKEKIFQDGRTWMSLEVMMPQNAENIIKYGITELRLHGTLTYDEQGEPISQINKEAARMFEGMLRQINADKQKTFTVRKLSRVSLPPVNSFAKKKAQYISELQRIMNMYGVKGNNTMVDAKKNYFDAILKSIKIQDQNIHQQILERWTYDRKSIRIAALLTQLPKEQRDAVKKINDNIEQDYKAIQKPLELLFLKLGVDVLSLMSDFMAMNPDETVRKIKDDLDSIISSVRKTGNPDLLNKLNYELERLDSIGGMKKIIPAEGITFFYKGELLKITGVFAPVNQILGLRFKM